MISEEILAKIKELRQIDRRIKTNCYIAFQTEPGKVWDTLESEKSLIIKNYEGGKERILFYTCDFCDLKKLAEQCSSDSTIEILSKNKEDMAQEMENIGYYPLTHMCRVSCADITEVIMSENMTKEYDPGVGAYADISDAGDIRDILWDTFDTRVSHLPTSEELVEYIKNREFYIIRDDFGQIVTLIQSKISAKSYYCNQVINKGDKENFHKAVYNVLRKYVDEGGKYAFAWVEEENIASLKFFEKYNLKNDGLWNTVYIKNNS